MSQIKTETLNVRIRGRDKKKFLNKCKSINRNYGDMIREMVDAFNNDKLTINIPESKLEELETFYNVTRK